MNFTLFNHLPTGIIVLNDSLEIVFWNLVMEDLSGFDHTEMHGKHYSELYFYEDDNGNYPIDLKSCFNPDTNLQRQVFIQHK
ncbi:MAG: PAS domain-containing protein, partial [Calditrichaeota bacterium]|nr:PAS domain-containing protein [Calditrichota bacterium]